jgi:hypothetical protein
MKTRYFTFGQSHVHVINETIFDRDVIVEITSEDPRTDMFNTFLDKWAFEYENLNKIDLSLFPKGIINLNNIIN